MSQITPIELGSETPCLSYLRAFISLNHVPSLFTLRLGRQWTAQSLPAGIVKGTKKQCYSNAGMLAFSRPDLTYVEGYACPKDLIPVHHAWCIDANGRVYDNTFEDSETADYYGVPIPTPLMARVIRDSGMWGLFAEHMRPEFLLECLQAVQNSSWAVPDEDIRDLLGVLLKFTEKHSASESA